MARGWESKAVEDQIEEGKRMRDQRNSAPAASADERDKLDRLKSLELSKARILDQLDRAKLPAHRAVLLNGLKDVERQIEELSGR